jgi:hypothetical protein
LQDCSRRADSQGRATPPYTRSTVIPTSSQPKEPAASSSKALLLLLNGELLLYELGDTLAGIEALDGRDQLVD